MKKIVEQSTKNNQVIPENDIEIPDTSKYKGNQGSLRYNLLQITH